MKNNKALIIVGVILINLLAIFMIGQSLLGKATKYDRHLDQARAFSEQKLYSRALEHYEKALNEDESLTLRMEMLDVINLGISSGELDNQNEIIHAAEDMLEMYPKDTKAYEKICSVYMEYGKYDDCTEVLLRAKSLKIGSEKLDEIIKEIRYLYEVDYTTYTDVSSLYDGMYIAVLEDGQCTYLDSEANDEFKRTYSYASSFSQGYAFVKFMNSDGTETATIIDKEGQRQVYLEGVVSSSGVGHAFTEKGDLLHLLSCRVGEKYKYYTLDGKEAFGDYDFAGRFRNNVAAVQENAGQWKLINGQGKAITETVFEDVVLNEYDECAPKGLIFAKTGGKYHLYDTAGKQIGTLACDGAKTFVDGYAAIKMGELWGYADTKGNVVIEAQYAEANSFSCGVAGVKLGDYWGYINAEKEIVIEGEFEAAGHMGSNGLCYTKINGRSVCLEMYYREN